MRTLIETLTNYIAACFSGLWIETYEPDEAVREIESLCREQSWNLATWDIDLGLQGVEAQTADPLSAVKVAGQGPTSSDRNGDCRRPTG